MDNNNNLSLLDLNKRLFGQNHIKNLNRKRFFRDLNSYLYLLKHFKIKNCSNLFFTKLNVPTGEGFLLGLDGKRLKRNLLKKIKQYPDEMPIPKYFEMETTTVCNKKCLICEYIYWPKNEQVRRHMAFDEFKHIIDQFPDIRWTNLTGEGSSFLNKDYPKMLKYLWEKHQTSIWLVDHLDDISMEKLEKEVFPYIHGIYVSMDAATKETYEKIKIGCNYDKVISNLNNIINYKRKNKTPFPHLTFRYIIIDKNVHELPLFLDLVNSIASQKEWGGSSTMVEFTGLLYFKDIQKYYIETIPGEIIDEVMKRKDGIEFQFAHAEENTNPPIEECTAWLEPYFMMPGYVLPCCAVMMSNNRPMLREYSFGNLFDNDIKNIWRNEYYTKFRSIVNDPGKPVPKICAGCRAYATRHRIKNHGIWDHLDQDTS